MDCAQGENKKPRGQRGNLSLWGLSGGQSIAEIALGPVPKPL